MHRLLQAISEPAVFIALPPEELAMRMLPVLAQKTGGLQVGNCCIELSNAASRRPTIAGVAETYNRSTMSEVLQAFVEAWAWLEAQGLIVPVTDGMNSASGFKRLSRRAMQIASDGKFKDYISSRLLSREMIHPSVRDEVWLAFARGDYDAAVLKAMKQVEVAVRAACGYGAAVIGTDLMRQAFHSDTGPLTDTSVLKAEREARQHLFAGAIGSYKNPQSHRHVNLEDPHETIEQIMLASHLLRIVETRVASKRGPKLS